jgi:hypothetical protein
MVPMFARRAAAVALLIAASTPATAQAPGSPPPPAWESVATKQACGVRQGPVMIGTPDGKHFSLFISGVKIGDRPMRSITLDGKPYLLAFAQANQMGMADLDAATLGALSAATELVVDWPEGKAELRTEGLLPALNAATTCGAKLDAKRVAEAQRAERLRRANEPDEFWERLKGGDQGTGVSTTPTAIAGANCYKKREWTSGFNKNCVYDCLGSEAVQTIGMAELCPISIRSPR